MKIEGKKISQVKERTSVTGNEMIPFLDGKENGKIKLSNITSTGGTTDYSKLNNKPSIEGIELSGDKTLSDIGAASKTDLNTKQDTITRVNVTVGDNTGIPSGSASVSGNILNIDLQNIKGEDGVDGKDGKDGKDGTSINILGSYESLEELLEAHPTGSVGDGYLIQGDLYVWSETQSTWSNVGTILGPKGDTGLKGETGITPKLQVVENNLQVSYNNGSSWETIQSNIVPEASLATNNTIGGIKAESKTDSDTTEVKIDPSTGKLYVKPIAQVVENNYINNPDEEDLQENTISENTKVIQFADKEYNTTAFSGLGRVYLRKNVSASKNVLTSEMISKENTWYIIQYDYDLNGATINIPNGCVLNFQGGSFKNGTITGNNTKIYAPIYKIFGDDLSISGSFEIENCYPEWFGAKTDDESVDNGIPINKAFALNRNVQLGKGVYNIKTPIVIKSYYHLHGRGNYNTLIKKITTDEYETKNCIIYIDKESGSYALNVDIRDVQIRNDDYSVEYAIYSSGVAMSSFSNIICRGCRIGMYCIGEVWNINFYNIQCNGNTIHNDNNNYGWEDGKSTGFAIIPSVTGTSLLFDKCWARECSTGYYIKNVGYSVMNCCAADNITRRSYFLQDCMFTMNGCGTEAVVCKLDYDGILSFYNSNVVVNNFSTYNVSIGEGMHSAVVNVAYGKVILNACKFVNYSTTEGSNVYVRLGGKAIFNCPVQIPTNGKLGDLVQEGSTLSIDYGDRIITRNIDNALYNQIRKDYWNIGTTSQRPSLTIKGFQYFDTDLKRPIWYNGEKWVDAIGTGV